MFGHLTVKRIPYKLLDGFQRMTHPLYFAEYADKGVQSKNFHLKGPLAWRRFQLSQCFHFVLYLQYLITLKAGANTWLHWVLVIGH